MLFNLLLIAILGGLGYLFYKQKSQLDHFKKQSGDEPPSSTPYNNRAADDFSLGLTRLNNEFSGEVLLDPLTRLPGREAFEDRLLQAINQSKRFEKSFAIMLLDIQQFHALNEQYGHETGDKLLKEIAARLQGCIRQIDTVTRYAGDKFIFLLPQLYTPETAVYVAQRLLDSIVQPFEIDNNSISVNASIGISIYPADGNDSQTLIKNADSALHQAKIAGKSRYQFFQQEMHALGERELKISQAVTSPEFLQNLVIYYQPHINIMQNKVVCIQAIPHLSVPDIGLIPFSAFAKIAENNGKIIDVGDWLLKNTLAQFQKWHQEGFDPECLSINVRLRQIENPHFVYKVSQMLQDSQINPQKIIFEISGDNLSANSGTLEKAFEMLNHLGIQVAISVFSLGHFALQKITKLPVNYLKIDSKLVHRKTDEKPEGDVIVHMIMMLAKDMKISVIAEGVDNEAQRDLLQELGCEVMQGKLFGEPSPVDSVNRK